MPKFAHRSFEGGGIAIWKIDESAEHLYAMLKTSCYDEQLLALRHEARRAEWLAVRVLLKELFGEDKVIAYHSSGKPYLTDHSMSISVSHTKGYAALAYHERCSVGIDVEAISPRVRRIVHRFTHRDEAAYMKVDDSHERMMMQLINWSAKETLYKLVADPLAADFKSVFCIAPYQLTPQGGLNVDVALAGHGTVAVGYELFADFVCTWAVAPEGNCREG